MNADDSGGRLHRLKSYPFAEITLNKMVLLGKVAPKGLRLLSRVLLSEFLQTDTAEPSTLAAILAAIKVHYLLYDATRLAAICTAQLYSNALLSRRFLNIRCGINLIR